MGETIVDTEQLGAKLRGLGLDGIVDISLRKETSPRWKEKSKVIDEHNTIIDLEIAIDPIKDWYLPVGKFYNNTEGYKEEHDWRAEELKKLFGNDNMLSYFMTTKPDFRLKDSDSLTAVKSMLMALSDITEAGILVTNIAFKPFDHKLIETAKRITHSVIYEPYVIGER
jgi:hypothetical protein